MLYLYLSLLSALIVVADQVTKYLVVQNIPLHGHVPALHGFICLTYTQNTGGGWSILSGHTWVLVAVSLVFFAHGQLRKELLFLWGRDAPSVELIQALGSGRTRREGRWSGLCQAASASP